MLSIIGAVNIDVIATALGKYREKDSNPAKVVVSVGGVSMNYAHNLRLLREDVQFFTAFSDDALGQMARQRCADLGIDTTHSCLIEHSRANIFIGIQNAQGDLESAACDAFLTEHYVDVDYLSQHIDAINASSLVMIDANLSVSALAYLFDHIQVPLMIDGVSIAKTERIVQALLQSMHPHIHTLKLNQKEYEVFQQQTLSLNLASIFHYVLVTKGADGVDYYPFTSHLSPISFPALLAKQVVSTLGAGDAFLSGWAYSCLHHYPLERSLECAQRLAVHTLAVSDAVNPTVSQSIFSLCC